MARIRLRTFSVSIGILAVLVAFGGHPRLEAQTMMNGKEVRAYNGRVAMLNEEAGRITIDMDDGSVGHWMVGGYTVVLRGEERLPLHAVPGSARVRAWVSPDGSIQRIAIVETRPGSSAERMNGTEVRVYRGSVVMLNAHAGRIVINVDDGSHGSWQVGRYTVVTRGGARLPIASVLNSRKVRLWVSREGEVQRIDILETR